MFGPTAGRDGRRGRVRLCVVSNEPSEPEGPNESSEPLAGDERSVDGVPLRRLGRLGRLGRLLRPYPFEIFAVVNLVAAVLFLRSFHLRIDGRGLVYIVRPLIKSLPLYLLAGLLLAMVAVLIARRPVMEFFRRVARPGWLFHWLRLWAGIMMVTYAYGWLKVNVPLVNYRIFDQQLWDLDVLLHLGVSPSIFATQLVAGTPLMEFLDFWYDLWIQTVMFSLCFFVVFLRRREARVFVFSMLLLWGLGAWLYVAVPAVGPIYKFADVWQGIVMPHALGTQADLWNNYQTMVAGRTGQIYSFNPIKGVAALPSLHVGVHAFFALFCYRYVRPLAVVFLSATLLTFIGSVLTGWHYAVDGYVGIALAFLSFWIADRLEGRRPGDEPEPEETESDESESEESESEERDLRDPDVSEVRHAVR